MLSLVLLAGCSSEPPIDQAIIGKWKPIAAELAGEVFPIYRFGDASLIMTAEGYSFADDRGTYRMNGDTIPAQIDIVGENGPNEGEVIEAIVKISGDTLFVCYQLGSGERPGEFKTGPGTQELLVRYKRTN